MKNCEELRDSLSLVFADLRAGKIKPADAAQFANLAGKLISSAKVQIEYYTMRRETPAIEFLATSGKVVTSPKTKRALNVTR